MLVVLQSCIHAITHPYLNKNLDIVFLLLGIYPFYQKSSKQCLQIYDFQFKSQASYSLRLMFCLQALLSSCKISFVTNMQFTFFWVSLSGESFGEILHWTLKMCGFRPLTPVSLCSVSRRLLSLIIFCDKLHIVHTFFSIWLISLEYFATMHSKYVVC